MRLARRQALHAGAMFAALSGGRPWAIAGRNGETEMPTKDMAETVYEVVLERYKASQKSDNKSYDKTRTYGEKQEKRNRRMRLADENEPIRRAQRKDIGHAFTDLRAAPSESTYAQYGRIYINMNLQVLNCGELSRIACAEAFTRAYPATVFGFDEFDHEFCVVGPASQWDKADYIAVTALDTLTAIDLYVVDVWMRICCPIAAYGQQVLRVLDDWTGKGKQIAGPEEGEWLVPNGSDENGYQAIFLRSRIKKGLE